MNKSLRLLRAAGAAILTCALALAAGAGIASATDLGSLPSLPPASSVTAPLAGLTGGAASATAHGSTTGRFAVEDGSASMTTSWSSSTSARSTGDAGFSGSGKASASGAVTSGSASTGSTGDAQGVTDLSALGGAGSVLPDTSAVQPLLSGAVPGSGLSSSLPVSGLSVSGLSSGGLSALPVSGLSSGGLSALPVSGLSSGLPVSGLIGAPVVATAAWGSAGAVVPPVRVQGHAAGSASGGAATTTTGPSGSIGSTGNVHATSNLMTGSGIPGSVSGLLSAP